MSSNSNSPQELIARIKELETEVKQLKSRKKYGLVWEDKPEDVVLQCAKQIPVLKEIKSRKIVTDNTSPTNLLIEGDNYHALSVLNYTHKGKIDVIYTDPPYNTGNKDFIYNDNYVDREDSFRHSKWLSFMDKRLRLAKDLLKDSGVIFISIDDNEQAQLKLLCDSVFGENNFVNNIIWQRASGGGNAKGIVTGHDYIFVYQKSMPLIDFLGDLVDEKRFSKDKIIEKDGKKFYIDDDVVRKVFGKYESGVERRCYYEELQDYKNEKQISEIKNKIENGELFLIKQKMVIIL
jgi:adenine-specific DNA-methyltransferase